LQGAAGLGERTEQAFFTRAAKNQTEGAKSRSSVKEKEDRKFRCLFNDLVRDEKDKAKERPPVNEDLLSQLMFLNPELSTLPLDQEAVSADEVALLAAVQDGGDLPLLAEQLSAEEAAVTDAQDVAPQPTETADWEVQDNLQPTETVDWEVQDNLQPLMLFGGNALEEADHTLNNQEWVETSQPGAFMVAAPASTEAELQTAVKETETAERTESAMTVGIVEALGSAETTGVQTAKVTGATEDLQSEGDVIETETAGRAGRAETLRQRVSPEEAGEGAGFEALLEAPERETKTGVKTEEPHINGELFTQTFKEVVGETQIREQNPETTPVAPEPFVPENIRESLATQIVSGARLMVKDGMTKIQIQLEPAELGKLELSLVVERDLVAARFVTETQGVQSLIEANLPQLRSALEEMGLQVDLLQVGVQAEGDSQMANQNMTGGEQFQRNTGSKPLAEMFVAEEQIFGEEAWHGMVNLRI
jgi:flagellar hook-length control protein FliK